MVAKIEDINEAMKDVVDPELGINVVDLGLIYDMMVDDNNIAVLNMTLTSAACPCLLYTSPSPRDRSVSRMPSSA